MVQQVTTRSRIIQNDFALGVGLVEVVRGQNTSMEQQIELVFVFRTTDEIRYLDWTRYTRVALHLNGGPLVEYFYDATATGVDDDNEIITPIPAVTNGRWLKVIPTPEAYTTAQLNDISTAVNTSGFKQVGYSVFNTTLSRPVWATGSGGAATWVDSDGSVVHTPS